MEPGNNPGRTDPENSSPGLSEITGGGEQTGDQTLLTEDTEGLGILQDALEGAGLAGPRGDPTPRTLRYDLPARDNPRSGFVAQTGRDGDGEGFEVVGEVGNPHNISRGDSIRGSETPRKLPKYGSLFKGPDGRVFYDSLGTVPASSESITENKREMQAKERALAAFQNLKDITDKHRRLQDRALTDSRLTEEQLNAKIAALEKRNAEGLAAQSTVEAELTEKAAEIFKMQEELADLQKYLGTGGTGETGTPNMAAMLVGMTKAITDAVNRASGPTGTPMTPATPATMAAPTATDPVQDAMRQVRRLQAMREAGNHDSTATPAARSGDVSGTMYDKANRAALALGKDPKNFLSLVERMTEKTHGPYKAVTTNIEDTSQLKDYQQLDQMNQKTKLHLEKFDMAEPFIKVLAPNGNTVEEIRRVGGLRVNDDHTTISTNVFESYHVMTTQEVALSNAWIRMWQPPEARLAEDLDLSEKYLENIIEPKLMDQIRLKYDSFSKVEKGGPLLFLILMHTLLYTSSETCDALRDHISKLNISTIPGENIKDVHALIMSSASRIWFAMDQRFPSKFIEAVFRALQTTSVPAFNTWIANLYNQYTSARLLAASTNSYGALASGPSPGSAGGQGITENNMTSLRHLLRVSELYFDDLTRSGVWAKHVKGKTKQGKGQGGFSAGGSDRGKPPPDQFCFNCGKSGHRVAECRKAHDQSRIDANKKKYLEAKKKSQGKDDGSRSSSRERGGGDKAGGKDAKKDEKGSRRSKYREPEPHEKGFRVIDGKPHKWSAGTKRWVAQNTPAAHSAGTGSDANEGGHAAGQSDQINQMMATMANMKKFMEKFNEGL
jgi:hypothetical protein